MLGIRVIWGIDLLAPLTHADEGGGDIRGDVQICLHGGKVFMHLS